MTFTEQEVEWIVVEVLRRLGLASQDPKHPNAASANTELRIAEQVVTWRLIEDRLTNVTRVVVPPRAVVTPAVRDELKLRKIELVREVST